MKMVLLTRKIQLFIHHTDDEAIKAHYQTLYRWRYIVFRALNMVSSHLFVQEQLKDFFYFTEGFHLKLKDQAKDEEGVLNTSKLNTTSRLLSRIFKGEMPSDILCTLAYELNSVFSKEIQAYRNGERSLRSYGSEQPLPFKGRSIKELKADGYDFSFTLFKIPFKTCLGKDRDKRQLLTQVVGGKLKLCGSAIAFKGSKLFLLARFEMQKQHQELDDSVIAEASLSIDHPISLNIEGQHYLIGNREEFLHRRLVIQSARHRAQKGASYNRGGHGYRRKTKSLEQYREMEKNYVDSRLHLYSRRLVELCLKKRAATLILVNQHAKQEVAMENDFLLQNWSYYGLIEKIKYKAGMAGITVVVE
ncbi:MAG: hypothetical protein EOP49_09450 [Sphingobacteriales bacterium]|nr:MAG: hypothetical protein EOP49_09450 [Sphingobacteriales bacterium]